MRRFSRYLLATIAILLVGTIIAIAAIGLWLNTNQGHRWVAAELSTALSTADTRITITGFAGDLPFHIDASEIRVADRNGVWLTLHDVTADVARRELFRRRLKIERILIGGAEVARAPVAQTQPTGSAGPSFTLPRFSFPIELAQFTVSRLSLGPGLLGRTATLNASANAVLDARGAAIHMRADRIDGIAGSGTLDGSYGPDGRGSDRLDLTLGVHDPSGLMMRAIAPANSAPLPLTISLSGQGPLTNWSGHLDASAGRNASVRGDFRLTGNSRQIDATVRGGARLLPLLPPRFAAILGSNAEFNLDATLVGHDVLHLRELTISGAAGRLMLAGTLDGKTNNVALHGDGDIALSPFSDIAGIPLAGRGTLQVALSNAGNLPHAAVTLATHGAEMGGFGAADTTTHLSAIRNPDASYQISGTGFLARLTNKRATLPAGLGARLDWSGAVTVASGGKSVQLIRSRLDDKSLHLSATGAFLNGQGQAAFDAVADDLAALAPVLGRRVDGSAHADGVAYLHADHTVDADLKGNINTLRIGIPAADALVGGSVSVTATLSERWHGPLVVSELAVTGKGMQMTAAGRFEPAGNRVSGQTTISIPKLALLSQSLGVPVSGSMTLATTASGPIRNLGVNASLAADGASIGSHRFDRLRASAVAADHADTHLGVQVSVISGALSESVTGVIAREGSRDIALDNLVFDGSGAVGRGALLFDRSSHEISGQLTAAVDDLSPWSGVLGHRVRGRGTLAVRLDRGDGQGAEVVLRSRDFVWEDSSFGVTVGRLSLHAAGSALFSKPRGTVSCVVADLHSGALVIQQGDLNAASRDGRTIRADLDLSGKMRKNFALRATGLLDGLGHDPRLTVSSLSGTVGSQAIRLQHEFTVSRTKTGVALNGLDAGFGTGTLAGNAQLDAATGHFALAGQRLDLKALGSFAGDEDIAGTLTFDLSLAGPWRHPAGKIAIQVPDLKLAAADQPELPSLAASATATLYNGNLSLDGQIQSLRHETVTIHGTIPIAVNPGSRDIVAPSGPLDLSVKGNGRLEDIASVLPLGEDNVAGTFSVDLGIVGPISAPSASGHFALSNGSYDSLSTGISLRDLNLELDGNQSALTLRRLDATDGGDGRLSGSGRVMLGAGASSSLNLGLAMKHFTVTRLDEATVVASGTAQVSGAFLTPLITSNISIDHADIQVPDRLPAQIPTIAVIRVNSLHPIIVRPPPPVPTMVARFQVKVRAPGQIMISGQGISSEWRADLAVTGTNAAPNVVGQIEAVRGTYELLGKTFNLQRGAITFAGGGVVNPTLDILAERAAADITATVMIKGTVSSPGLTLTSVPQLPQDEILSRVLFDTSVGQISPVQALQLAQTLAAFTGSAPDVMSNARNMVGLDQLTIDSDTTTSSGASKGVLGDATLSGGKYVASGVFVGVRKGLAASDSQGEVQVTVSPHVTVDGIVGAGSSSSSLGLTYRRDY